MTDITMTIKRLTIITAVLSILLPVTADAATLSVAGDINGARCSAVTVPVVLDDVTGLLAADLVIEYDRTVLELRSGDVTAGDLTTGWSVIARADNIAGRVKIAAFGTIPLTGGSGSIANIEFRVRGEAQLGASAVTISDTSELNEGGIDLSRLNGAVQIVDVVNEEDCLLIELRKGFNLISYSGRTGPVERGYEIVEKLGNMSEIDRLRSYDREAGMYREVRYNGTNEPSGENFQYIYGEGYIVYAKVEKTVRLIDWQDCGASGLKAGLNLVGLPCAPQGLGALQLLQNTGGEGVVASVQRFNAETGRLETAGYKDGQSVGVDFTIREVEGYIIYMKQDRPGFQP